MKKILLSIAMGAAIFSCTQQPSYKITGSIEDAEGYVYLKQRVGNENVAIDSALIENGTFTLEGTVEFSDAYTVVYEKIGGVIFLENSDITASVIDGEKRKSFEFVGSATQDTYNAHTAKTDAQMEAVMAEYKLMQAEPDEVKKAEIYEKVDELYSAVGTMNMDFIKNNPSSAAAAFILERNAHGMDADSLNSYLVNFTPEIQKTQAYVRLNDRVKVLESVAVGKIAPNFSQADADGNMIELLDVCKEHKYLLVDFWASWCGPCRAENPNVVEAFKKYNAKGFGVFGVSLDQDKDKWLEAVEKDGLTWKHVSDLKGWSNEFAKAYGVNSIPANFLLDQNGKIIATGLREEELHNKIEELLK